MVMVFVVLIVLCMFGIVSCMCICFLLWVRVVVIGLVVMMLVMCRLVFLV